MERAGHEATLLLCPRCPLWLSTEPVAVTRHFPGCPACPAYAGSGPTHGQLREGPLGTRLPEAWPFHLDFVTCAQDGQSRSAEPPDVIAASVVLSFPVWGCCKTFSSVDLEISKGVLASPPPLATLSGCDMCPDLLQREVAPGVILTKWGEILSEIISSFPRDLA